MRDFLLKALKTFGILLGAELLEEILESIIAYGISTLISTVMIKALSIISVALLTQTAKITIKSLSKVFVKKVVYKDGNDKIKKIEEFLTRRRKQMEENKLLTKLKGLHWLEIVGIIVGTLMIAAAQIFPDLAIAGFEIGSILTSVGAGIGGVSGLCGVITDKRPLTEAEQKKADEKIKLENEKLEAKKVAEAEKIKAEAEAQATKLAEAQKILAEAEAKKTQV